MTCGCGLSIAILFLTINSIYIILAAAQASKAPPAVSPATSPTTEGGGEQESKLYPVDEEKLKVFQESICPCVPIGGESPENSTWSDLLTSDELYELALLSLGYGLTTDAVAHLPIDLGWRKLLLDQISYISRITCRTEAISSMFLSGVKNLFLFYMSKFEKSLMNGTETAMQDAWKAEKQQDKWTRILAQLSTCAAEVDSIEFQDDCGALDSYLDQKGDLQPVKEVYEQFDKEFENPGAISGLDMVVDSVWWMFMVTYARCYAHAYPNADIILEFLQRFREDVIKFFSGRWRGAGELDTHFDLIFGNIETAVEHENLRKCATSAFDFEGLVARHLVRPVIVTVDGSQIRNFKLEPEVGPGVDW